MVKVGMKTMNDDNRKPKPKKHHSKDESTSRNSNDYNLSATIVKYSNSMSDGKDLSLPFNLKQYQSRERSPVLIGKDSTQNVGVSSEQIEELQKLLIQIEQTANDNENEIPPDNKPQGCLRSNSGILMPCCFFLRSNL
jgi:hypothetical protein